MKNISNLLSDAFVRMGKNETDYYILIQDKYKVTITSRQSSETTFAKLTLIMNTRDELHDYHEENTLFTNEEWDNFCSIIERQIQPYFISAGHLLQIAPLLYPINNDFTLEDEQPANTEEVGDFILY